MPLVRLCALSAILGILAVFQTGCQLASFIYLCDGDETECALIIYAEGYQYPGCEPVSTDPDGCVSYTSVLSCEDQNTYCGLQGSTTYIACNFCDDPVLAQWPDAWTVTSTSWYKVFPPPLSGSILIEPAANFDLPEGVGPIVTDPGYSAYVLRLNTDDLPKDLYAMRIEFDRGDLPFACAKGVEVALVTFEPGNHRFIQPLPGESLDLTSYTAPDPHVLCLEEPTSVQPSTWGWIKSIYR